MYYISTIRVGSMYIQMAVVGVRIYTNYTYIHLYTRIENTKKAENTLKDTHK